MTTDNTQELDEIVSDLILDLTSEVTWQEVQAGVKAGMAIRNWHKKHELQAEKEMLKRVLPYLKRPGMYDIDLVSKEYIGRLKLVEQELEGYE